MSDVRCMMFDGLVSLEDISCIDFVLDIVEDGVVAVGDDDFALGFELRQVVDYQ